MKIINYFLFLVSICFATYMSWDSIQHIRAEVLHRNGYIKNERGYPHLAIIDLEKTVKLMPWETHYRLQLAKAFEKAAAVLPTHHDKYIQQAIHHYKRLIEMDALNPWYNARLGLIFYELHKKNPSINDYKESSLYYTKQAATLDNKNPLFLMHYGHLLMNYNQYAEAKELYELTVSYDKLMIEAHHNLVLIYEVLNESEKKVPHLEYINDYLDSLEEKLSNMDPSSQVYKQTQAKQDQFISNRVKLSLIYLEKNQPSKAIQLIDRIPESVEKFELYAKYYQIYNQPELALKLYQQLKNATNSSAYDEIITSLSNQ